MTEKKAGEILNKQWESYLIPWREYGTREVPKDIQAFVENHPTGCFAIGNHPDGRYFIAELYDVVPAFAGWWPEVALDNAL